MTTSAGKLDGLHEELHIRNVSGHLVRTMRTLRFCEERSLIKPNRKVGHRRVLPKKGIERLRLIVKLKSVGLSRSEVRAVLTSPGKGSYELTPKLCADIIVHLCSRKAEVEAALAQAQKIPRAFPPKAWTSSITEWAMLPPEREC